MWTRIKALMVKEIHAIWRDKRSRAVLILPPIIQLFLFAFAATLDVKNVTLGVLNKDNGHQSVELLQRFYGSPTFSHIIFLDSVRDIASFIDNQRGSAVLSIDEQFSRKVEAGQPVDIQLILDGRKSNSTQIIAGYVGNIVSRFNSEIAARERIPQVNIELVPRSWFNPNLLYYWFNVPSLCGILVMLVSLILTALSVARERELGTFDQLLVSPISSSEIMIGKVIPSVIISILEGTFIILAAVYVFRIPFMGSVVLLYFSMFIFVCCIVGFGLFISSLCNTQQQALLGSALFMTPSILMSGFATPIENMPAWLQPFTLFIPLRYFLVIIKGIFLKAMPFHIVFSNLWPLVVIAVATLSAATWLFRRRLE